MFARFMSPSTAVLVVLLLSLLPVRGRAEGARLARGFVIYKKVPSDLPAHYSGTLFLGSTPGPVWLEYDVGQAKPFYLARDLFVNEIKFGALFEADFTTDKHVEYCRSVQAQLAAAAKQSPQLAGAANAATKAIQAEMDRYEKGSVRVKGKWIEREKHLATQDAEQKARMATMTATKAADEAAQVELRAKMEKRKAAERILQKNLSRPYVSVPAQNLIQNFEAMVKSATAAAGRWQVLPVSVRPDPGQMVALPQNGIVTPMLQVLGGAESDSVGAVLYTFNADMSKLVGADVALHMESSAPGQSLTSRNKAEVASVKKVLDQFDSRIFDCVPDVIAASRIMAALKDTPPTDRGTPFNRTDMAGYRVLIEVFRPQELENRYVHLVLITIRPAT